MSPTRTPRSRTASNLVVRCGLAVLLLFAPGSAGLANIGDPVEVDPHGVEDVEPWGEEAVAEPVARRRADENGTLGHPANPRRLTGRAPSFVPTGHRLANGMRAPLRL